MGGSIIVAKQNSVIMRTVYFDYLVERIRQAFPQDAEGLKAKIQIYEPFDLGGMAFIVLDNQDARGFNIFYQAAEQARSLAAREEEAFARLEPLWNELLTSLRWDPRYAPNNEPG
jgi:hypothetical protein